MADHTVTQPPYVTKLAHALRRGILGAEVTWEHVHGKRYRFIVFSGKFDKLDHAERQQRVWDIAERGLTPADLLKVSMILTMGTEDVPRSE